jgi:hypothetical protein
MVSKLNHFFIESNIFAIFKGICYHMADIYLEELGKFGDSLKPVKAVRMIYVFAKCLAVSTK